MLFVLRKIKGKAYGVIFNRSSIGEILTVLHSLSVHLRFSFSERKSELDKEQLEYYIVKHCHIVEKGLALPFPRKGFGQPKILDLIARTHAYEKHYSNSQISLMVRDTLREYLGFHAEDLQLLPDTFLETIRSFLEEKPAQGKGGLKNLKKSEMNVFGGESFERFLKCRHSIRNFSGVPVSDEVIMKALAISQNTPSVCNRQGWFVHYYKDKKKINELLSFQNGNAGFTESIDKLLIVTASTKAFTRNEHNQLFIDGGLYSMNLMLSLHSVGLGSCPLNTCMPWFKAKRLKRAADISQHERVIMMVAVGNLQDEFSVAQSEKYALEKTLRLH